MSIPKTALPIIDWDDSYCGATDTLYENEIPLCPHCKDWSHYTTAEAVERGGYTICPFCQGEMYMPSDLHACNVESEGDINVTRNKQPEVIKLSHFSGCDSCDGTQPCKFELLFAEGHKKDDV